MSGKTKVAEDDVFDDRPSAFSRGDAFENEPAALAWRAAGRGSRPSSRAGFYLNLNAFFRELRAFVKKPWLFLGATRLNG